MAHFNLARAAMREIVDLTEPKANLFLRLCLQNQGHLSANKRKALFSFLTDEEVFGLEAAIQAAYRDHLTQLPSGGRA